MTFFLFHPIPSNPIWKTCTAAQKTVVNRRIPDTTTANGAKTPGGNQITFTL
jgi:hypothetical protein